MARGGFVIEAIEYLETLVKTNMGTGKELEEVKSVDWGSIPPMQTSIEMPMIFITPRDSIHPGTFAAQGAEAAYTDEVTLMMVIYTYILEDGYRESLIQASDIFDCLRRVMHANKQLGGLFYTSEFGEGEDVGWGVVEWPQSADNIVYGISIPLVCKRIGQEA
jgi:hypothetical protein